MCKGSTYYFNIIIKILLIILTLVVSVFLLCQIIFEKIYGLQMIWRNDWVYYTIWCIFTIIAIKLSRGKKFLFPLTIVFCIGLFIHTTLYCTFKDFLSSDYIHYFDSPNSKCSLLVLENQNLTGCGIRVYQVRYKIFKGACLDSEFFGEPDPDLMKGVRINWLDDYNLNVSVSSDGKNKNMSIALK